MQNELDSSFYILAFCAEASQRSLDATSEIAYATF